MPQQGPSTVPVNSFLLAPVDAVAERLFIAGRDVVDGFRGTDAVWSMTGEVRRGDVTNDTELAAAIETALRGADLLVTVAGDLMTPFEDAVERIGLRPWHTDLTEWSGLLDALAAGASVSDAARRNAMSLRSAHRRLATARRLLDVETNVAAVAVWVTLSGRSA